MILQNLEQNSYIESEDRGLKENEAINAYNNYWRTLKTVILIQNSESKFTYY